jgi:hypothetical protein
MENFFETDTVFQFRPTSDLGVSESSQDFQKQQDIVLMGLVNLIRNSDLLYRQYEKRKAILLIQGIVQAYNLGETDVLERELYSRIHSQEDILSDIINDPQQRISIRAMASRLFIAKVFGSRTLAWKNHLRNLAAAISYHESPMIRMGALLGYSDAGATEIVRNYLSDPHPTVSAEALDLLEDD